MRAFMTTVVLCVTSLLMLTSCASYFVRKDCEKENWFTYGQSVAMQGRRLTGDDRVKKCEAAGADINGAELSRGFKAGMANYCMPDTVFQTGKKGEFFNVEMCDGEQPRFLQKRHAEGVREYCAKTNGYSAGSTGRKYNNVCPKDLEAAFLPEFNRGRKTYLKATIENNETRITEIDSNVRGIDNERMMLMAQMSAMGNGKIITRELKYDPITRATHEETKVTEDPETVRRRDSLRYDMERKQREIEAKRAEQEQLRKQNREMKTELATL
ncbi:MAG: DUF2799 domain-containing protein [Bdellovibrionota bacterium]